jgi:hypothetical protein
MKSRKFEKTDRIMKYIIKIGFILLMLCVPVFLFSFQVKKAKSINWINVSYTDCLKNKLPCECEELTRTYFAMTLDTNKRSAFYGVSLLKYNLNEFEQFKIKEESSNHYKVFKSYKDSIRIIGTLVLNKDTAYFIDKETHKTVFVNYGVSESFNKYQYLKQNVDLLNKSFHKRKYPSLENILKEDSLNCNCNKELGKVNLLWVEGRDKSWILEQNKGNIYLYDYVNSADDRSIPPKIDKRLIKSFKW